MLSNSSKYAIKAVLFLALNSNNNKRVMVKDISEPINVPQAYLAKLLQPLVKEGLISSVRGPKGGFYLNDENLNNTIIDIIRVIDGDDKFDSCMLSLEKCNKEKPCPLHNILSSSRNSILNNLKNRTLSELIQEVEKGNAYLPV
ncbi:Rrf2 family transcriptional regulator [Seonamhaeicola sp. MEBiC1930]|uniref:RrF2 family transcriptional regulator n=1 Tax=Seonamhaeicola sp. MEBiC01930 TaxID=2976768 RepID=UPI00324CAC7D